MSFARRVFATSGVYGLILMTPQFFLDPGPRPELHYGFVGAVFAWQLASLFIAGDPLRYRPIMPVSGLGKVVFSVAALALVGQGRAPAFLLGFAAIDLLLAALFLVAWRRTRPAPALFS